jgi:glycerol-3-phosphate cytidylyltransferase
MNTMPGPVSRHRALVATGSLPAREHPRPAGQRGTAITYGTYDLFHVGHVRLFQRIKERCDFLIVAVSTDEFNAVKGKASVMPFADRLELVRSCRFVDLAIAENGWDQKESDIAAYGVDAFYMGDDWTGRFDHLKALCDVHYLPRTNGVSSTLLKHDVVAAVKPAP